VKLSTENNSMTQCGGTVYAVPFPLSVSSYSDLRVSSKHNAKGGNSSYMVSLYLSSRIMCLRLNIMYFSIMNSMCLQERVKAHLCSKVLCVSGYINCWNVNTS